MTSLDEFRQTYLRLCKDHHVEPQDCVINQIKACQDSGVRSSYSLDLSTHSLTVKTCAVLAKVLATDRCFSEIHLNDCMLPEEGVRALAHGLGANVACKKLELKGNNIRASATEALGKMLKNNTTILSLCLEWNAMGMIDTSFGLFCEGLGSNGRLQILDLRNNQITHDGATELAAALKRNLKLKAVDLRWNSIGLIGARALLNMMQHNRNLVKLELTGNNIPGDIHKSIDTAVGHNQDRASLVTEHHHRQHMLSGQIQQMHRDKKMEMADLMGRLDKQDAAIRNTTRSSQQRISQLQGALEDRKSQFNTIATKLSLVESELSISETKVNELSSLLAKSNDDKIEMAKMQQNELKREREEKALMEARLNKDVIDGMEKNLQLENKLDELERKVKNQQENIFDLKEQLAHNLAESKMKATEYEEKISLEKHKTKESYREAEEMKHKEIDRVKREAEETEKGLKDRINKMENHRLELEEEISRLKANNVTERLNAEEQIMNAKQRIKSEEEHRAHTLEEKLRMVQGAKDELQAHSASQANSISDLQTKMASLTLENEALKHKNESLNQELVGKNNDMLAEVAKARMELQQRIQKLESERATQQELYDKVSRLEKDLAETNMKHSSSIHEKDLQITQLREQLKSRDAEIKHMKEEDSQRATMLQSAIQNYVTRTPYGK